MKNIKLIVIALIAGLFVQTTNAATLNISNHSYYNLAFTINGVCIGNVADTTQRTISEGLFKKMCGEQGQCLIQAYTNGCYSTYAGGVVYNEKDGSVFVDRGDAPGVVAIADVTNNQLNVYYSALL